MTRSRCLVEDILFDAEHTAAGPNKQAYFIA